MNIANIRSLLREKRVLLIAGSIILVILLIILFLTLTANQKRDSASVKDTQPTLSQKQQLVTPQTQFIPSPVASVDLETAIEEAKQSAQEYDNQQANLRSDYPWLRKLPLAGKKYFVYFNLSNKSFIGRLYPTADNNVEEMKANIIRQLKEDKGIPIESYDFRWMIYSR